MNAPVFSRLFTIGAFEGLRIIREHRIKYPEQRIEEAAALVKKLRGPGLDFDTAIKLDEGVPQLDPFDQTNFYRECIRQAVMHNPIWKRTATQGRKKFVEKLSVDEAQCFRFAGLLEDPATSGTVAWWDEFQSSMRAANDEDKLKRGRQAERLTLEYERRRLADLNIAKSPIWMALEDNTVGYDVLSYDYVRGEAVNLLIEVKSFSGSTVRFYLTRREWQTAQKYESAYRFHVWNLDSEELFVFSTKTIEALVPRDGAEEGAWTEAIITPLKNSKGTL